MDDVCVYMNGYRWVGVDADRDSMGIRNEKKERNRCRLYLPSLGHRSSRTKYELKRELRIKLRGKRRDEYKKGKKEKKNIDIKSKRLNRYRKGIRRKAIEKKKGS